MENHHGSAAPPNAKQGGSGPSAGCPENKDVTMPNLSGSAAEVTATVATSTDEDDSKGKSVAVADDNKEQLPPHIVAERKRRSCMNDYFGELQSLIPQIPEKSDKGTIVAHTIDYIRSLEKTMATLEKRKREHQLAQQAAAEAVASSSSAAPPPPQTAEGMALAAMSADITDASSHAPPLPPTMPVPQLLIPETMSSDVPPQPLQQPPQLPIVTARQVGFQTWSWPDLVLSVLNDTAYISVCAPRHRGMWTMVMVLSVLNKYGIDVVTAQVDSDAVRRVFNIYARVTGMVGENSSALAVYQLAVSEILVWLNS